MKTIVLIVLIVLLVLAFIPDTWLIKVAKVGGPKVAGTVLKVSGWIKKIETQLVGLVKRRPKLVDPKTGEPLPAPPPLAPKEGEVSARAVEPSGWRNILKKVLPVALPVLVGLIVVVGVGFIRSKRAGRTGGWGPEAVEGEVLPMPSPSQLDAPSDYGGYPTPATLPYVTPYASVAPSRPLDSLAREWGRILVFVWAFTVLCLAASKLPVVPVSWQEMASFLVNFSLLGVTPFVIMMFTGEALSNILAPLAAGAEKLFGDTGRSVVALINYTAPLVALVGILLLLVAKTGGNVVNFAVGTGAPAVSTLAIVLSAITAGDPFNVALICLSLVGYVIVVMRKIF